MALWMFAVIFIRETLITAIRLRAIRKGEVLAAEAAGKVKTVSQIAVIMLFLIYLILRELPVDAENFLKYFFLINYLLLYAVVALTIFSGFSFLWNNRKARHER